MTTYFYSKDHPRANGRTPIAGEESYTLCFPLHDGNDLALCCGRESFDRFAEMIGSMAIDDAACAAQPSRPVEAAPEESWITNVLQDVAELPDRDSPEGWPEAMLVTGPELEAIIKHRLPQAVPAPPADTAPNRLQMKLWREYNGEELAIFWESPYGHGREKIASFWWPYHPVDKTQEVERIFEALADKWVQPPADRAQKGTNNAD